MSSSTNWTTITESKFPWEREALEFVRERFPTHEPYRAWSNFEFIADDGSINEVDLLVFSRYGFFLIEIKSRPGQLTGDAGTWIWKTDGKLRTTDNPLSATNLKAKKLRSLLERQRAFKSKGRVPFLEALVFCSAPDLQCDLHGNARFRVCLRDKDATDDTLARPGIMAAIAHRQCPGLDSKPKGTHDKPTAKKVSQALDQAGIRPSQRSRKVSDFVLNTLIGEGPGYQDWEATHSQIETSKRRIRIYLVQHQAGDDERKTIVRAARREAQLLEMLDHRRILRFLNYTDHELGPALVFEHDPSVVRLDHYLAERQDRLGIDQRLQLMRQIAEVVQFAHEKKVIHRALSPQSVLVSKPDSSNPQIKVFNWQAGYRSGSATNPTSIEVTATSHVDRLVEDASTAYMAPEALVDISATGEHLDVFSLGAIAYHIFASQAPASNGLELSNSLRTTKGLKISAVLNGAGQNLQDLIQYSTHPEVPSRIDTVTEFLSYLDLVEEDLTTPDHDIVEDPTQAQQGSLLPGNLTVVRRLGQGACSVALLVNRDGEDFVLKAAATLEDNTRVDGEASVLEKLHHELIVRLEGKVEIGDHKGFLMRPVLAAKDKKRIETLGDRLRREGRLHIDLLQRFGEDLLRVVAHIEEQGIPHRDIKPDNIAVGMIGRGDKLHLVLFDFSLSRTPAENIRAGTNGYLDPLLPLRKPLRWDLQAERYAAAATLYEMAAGPDKLPVWGDGTSDPSHLDCEATIDAELFDANLRDGLSSFFERAFRRDPSERFDNAEEMLRDWRQCFEDIERPGIISDEDDEDALRERLGNATHDTQIAELGLGTRATNALDRANILTVDQLLAFPSGRLMKIRGVGNKTRRELSLTVKILREALGSPVDPEVTLKTMGEEKDAALDDVGHMSVDMLAQLVSKTSSTTEREPEILRSLLTLDLKLDCSWPGQSDVARHFDLSPAAVHGVLKKAQARWKKEKAITRLRDDLVDICSSNGGVMSVEEMRDGLLIARGSTQDEPMRSRLAIAVVRAAMEVERTMSEPRLMVRRDRTRIVVALESELASYAYKLGQEADLLAEGDPLSSPSRAIERLRAIKPTAIGETLTDVRLIRLAAAASQNAALSSRQELYPQGMDAARAVKLSQGALLGVPFLSVEQIHDRVSSRYPSAEALPGRPKLDGLLRDAGLDFKWNAQAKGGKGCYVSTLRETMSVTTGSRTVSRLATLDGATDRQTITPEIADAREFEERLQRAARDGSFLALLVNPKYYQRAAKELCRRLAVDTVDFEGLFLDALREQAEKAKVSWDLVLKTDISPGEGDWDKLVALIRRAMPEIEKKLSEPGRTLLITYPSMLARYDQMSLLERLRDKVGRRDGIHGLWLLIAGDQQVMLNGRALPIIGPGQRVRIPESWLHNIHRANGHALANTAEA